MTSFTPGQTVTWNTSQLAVNGTVSVATVVAAPATLTSVINGGNLNLSWPANQVGYQLQTQSNPLSIGLSTNWVTVTGSTTTNQISIPLTQTPATAFYRLAFPK